MSKRRADKDLNHDNWDNEDEPEEKGSFKAASADVISQRVIKVGRRRLPQGESSKPAFSGFSGFGASAASNTSTAFKFLVNPTTSGNKSEKGDDSKNVEDKKSVFLSKLRGLNEEFLDWIKKQLEKNPTSILTPILKDYEKYLKELESERDQTPSSVSIFSNFQPSTKNDPVEKSKEEKPQQFLLNFKSDGSNPLFNKPPEDKKSEPSASLGKPLFSSTSDTVKPFSFFGSTSPSNDKTSDKPQPNFGSFGSSSGFGSIKFPPPPAAANNGSTSSSQPTTEEEPYEVPKNEFKQVVEEDAVFSKRVKLFSKADDTYKDKGVGTLYIKPANDKYQAVIRADTSIGNVLLNIILSSELPLQRVGKNNVSLVCTPDPKANPTPVTFLIRVKTGEEADELLDNLKKYQK